MAAEGVCGMYVEDVAAEVERASLPGRAKVAGRLWMAAEVVRVALAFTQQGT